jgi:hypothetical protein
MAKLSLFYQDIIDNDGYFYSDIMSWSDYRLEAGMDWLFPDKSELTDIEVFRTDVKIRMKVISVVSKILQFYGYMFTKDGVFQIKELKRQEKGRFIGLYSERNYKRLTRMMVFLNKINMRKASSLVMLALCNAMHKDLVLRKKIEESGALKEWFEVHRYLRPYIDTYDIKMMKGDCKFTGLNYTGNSCYQDSTLLALFAIPNRFITRNILEKNITAISNMANREIQCGRNVKEDLQRRKDIQEELVRISKSMRGELPEKERVEYCSNLRALIKECPSASRQAFHGTGTQDAGEFIQYLFSLFQVGGVFRGRTTIVTNDLRDEPENMVITNQLIEETSPIVLIPSQKILETERCNIKNFLNNMEDSIFDDENKYRASNGILYNRRIEQTSVGTGDYLVFYAQRLYVNGNKQDRTYNEVIPVETIELDKNLGLFSVVVHRNEHYTAYIKCDEKWFYYNDTNNQIVLIGNYNDMLNQKSKPNVKTEGVLYFYKE